MIDSILIQVGAGNHNIEKEEHLREIFLAYENHLDMPVIEPTQLGLYKGPKYGSLNMDVPPYLLPYKYGNAHYSISCGMTHSIFLNAYSSMDLGSTQYQWLIQEHQLLIVINVTLWHLVTMYAPVYNSCICPSALLTTDLGCQGTHTC